MNQDPSVVVNSHTTSLLHGLLERVSARSRVVKRTLSDYGQVSLAEYLCRTLSVCRHSLQSCDDLLEIVYRYIEPLLGETIAEKTVQELRDLPAVLTANHHGVDFLAQSVQGSLLFSLRKINGKPAATVPVFACGNIALNNPTFPRGLLLYHSDRKASKFMVPVKLPIFLDRWKRMSVCIVDAYDTAMLTRAEQRLAVMARDNRITPALEMAAQQILGIDYRNSMVLSLQRYSDQSVVLNNLIWKRCFSKPEHAPEMVCLELEKITSLLLQFDLNNEDSLIWQLMFNPTLRFKVLNQLDGARACWDKNKLTNRIEQKMNSHMPTFNGSGTIFFWGIDSAGWRVPLMLFGSSNQRDLNLQGRDDQGNLWSIPFNPVSILQALKSGNLLPSLFTCYSAISFARGISCCGGYFQADYLLTIQRGLATALSETVDCVRIAAQLDEVSSDIYLSGMQAMMRNLNNDLLLPVGPVEMIASGGISQNQLEQIRSLTVRDAHMAGLIETIPDFLSKEDLPDNWYLLVAEESYQLLKDKILII